MRKKKVQQWMILGLIAVFFGYILCPETMATEQTTVETTEEVSTVAEDTSETPATDLVVSDLSPADAKVIVLDPGHCYKHAGAADHGLREENVVWDIATACKDVLEQYGDVTVYMTRTKTTCCRSLNLGGCLTARSVYAKQLDADFLVSMHVNAEEGSSGASGAYVLAAYKSGYHDEIRKQTQAFGNIVLSNLEELGLKNQGLLLRKSEKGLKYKNGKLRDYYSIVNKGVLYQVPSVIIEHGYVTNESDCKNFLKTKKQRTALGTADAEAIIEYFGLEKSLIAGTFYNENGTVCYLTAEGKKVTGWVKSDGKWYYFDQNGSMATGFVTIGDQTFYLDPETGAMTSGWFLVDGVKYLAKGNGVVVQNQVYYNGRYKYLFLSSGEMAKNGLYVINGKTYYYTSKGTRAHGLTKYKGSFYYFSKKDGSMVTGWVKIGNKKYYFSKRTGKMIKKKTKTIKG